MNFKNLISVFTILLLSLSLNAQPRRELVKVIVSPDQADWTYEPGERAEFSISVMTGLTVGLSDSLAKDQGC